MNRIIAYVRGVFSSVSLTGRMYFVGYDRVCLPRLVRRIIARSRLHRAWLNGHMGLFEQDGRPHGVCDREWYNYRKGPNTNVARTRSALSILLHPYSYVVN